MEAEATKNMEQITVGGDCGGVLLIQSMLLHVFTIECFSQY